MSKTNFWKNWDTDLKYPYLFLMVLAAAALLLGGTITWQATRPPTPGTKYRICR